MFKLLVTTVYIGTGNNSLHTVVIEFNNQQDADIAAGLIAMTKPGTATQTVAKLYRV
jgi:hypothetical protein